MAAEIVCKGGDGLERRIKIIFVIIIDD